jgi:LacI family transcriptional regulator, repressor for deo operon, udp, cdd, tsx, nupC, and nupG
MPEGLLAIGGVTLESVARKAGVSVSTVSRALTRPDRVAKDTRESVLEAAQEMGYAPNQLARSLRQRGSRTIGLIISDIQVQFHGEVAKGVEDTAQAHGYTTILCNSDEDGAKEKTYLELLKGFRVGGLILEPTEAGVKNTEALVRSGVPVVEVDRISGAQGVTSVLSENLEGAAMAAQHLLGLGHTKIGVIAGDQKLTSGRERLQGFQNALAQHGLNVPPEWIKYSPYTKEEGERAALELLAEAAQPTAWFVVSSVLTVGVLQALRTQNIRIPQQISLIGFDDAHWASLTNPPLTVIAQSSYALGQRAAEIILEHLDAGKTRGVKTTSSIVRLPTRLIERESCARVRTTG